MSATQTGSSLTFTYDALGRKLTEAGPLGTATSTWNLDGTRATLALPGGGITETYDRDVTGLVTKVRENGASSGIGVLATYTYDNLQRRTAVANGNGTGSSYGFDPVSRLSSLTQDLAGAVNDLTISISAYNSSSQIVTQSRSNDLYAWTGHGNGSTDTVTNGLNQLATVGEVAAAHDARGNLTSDPASGNSYAYSSENLLTSATVGGNGVTLAYDPLLRLTQVAGTATTKFGYDGLDTLAEADGGGTILRRYAPGDGIDQPIVWYEGSGTTDRRWLHADERGSIVSVSDASGNMLGINTYDEFGKPGASNIGRFQYTGQKWLPELGLYDYKGRMYAPALGRFLQTDPIGYGSGQNIYAYVRGDPVNLIDPLGLADSATREVITPWCPEPGGCLGDFVPWDPGQVGPAFSVTAPCGSFCTSSSPGNLLGFPSVPLSPGSPGSAGNSSSPQLPKPPTQKPRSTPKYCNNPIYQGIDEVDKLLGKVQLIGLIGGVGMARAEPYAAMRASGTATAVEFYEFIGGGRLVLNLTKAAFYGDYQGSILDAATQVIGKAAGVDQLGIAVGGALGEKITTRVAGDQCK